MSEPEEDAVKITRLTDQAVVTGAQIDALEAQAVVDRELIAHLQAEGAVDQDKIRNLEFALVAARRIGTAVGILMARDKITSDAAFGLLVGASQGRNRKLRDIADDVVHTGVL